jgi:hypothetical protein
MLLNLFELKNSGQHGLLEFNQFEPTVFVSDSFPLIKGHEFANSKLVKKQIIEIHWLQTDVFDG